MSFSASLSESRIVKLTQRQYLNSPPFSTPFSLSDYYRADRHRANQLFGVLILPILVALPSSGLLENWLIGAAGFPDAARFAPLAKLIGEQTASSVHSPRPKRSLQPCCRVLF
jgi:hypothetical protein